MQESVSNCVDSDNDLSFITSILSSISFAMSGQSGNCEGPRGVHVLCAGSVKRVRSARRDTYRDIKNSIAAWRALGGCRMVQGYQMFRVSCSTVAM